MAGQGRKVRVLQVTREAAGDQRYGMGKAVAQLIDGLAALDIPSERYCAAALPAASLAQADERAQRWAARHGTHQLGILQVVSRAWQTGFDAARVAAERGFTHVHCHDAVVAHGFASAPESAGMACGITQHGFDSIAFALRHYVVPIDDALFAALARLESQVLGSLGWAVYMTRLGVNRVASQLGMVPTAQWHVVPHARPAWNPPDRSAARLMLGWRADQRVLLAVGQLIPLKRFDWIVRAMRGLDPRWGLVILGEGDIDAVMRAADEAGVARPHVTATDAPQTYYAAADAFTSASAIESFGMAHLEAMVQGLPVACTAVGGVPEVVGDAGILLPDDEAGFARGLRAFLGDEQAQRRASLQAAARAETWPDQPAIAQRHRSIYRGAPLGGMRVDPIDAFFA